VLAAIESLPKLDLPVILPPSVPTEEQLKLSVETQMELQRLGCLSAADSGDLNTSTASALKRYLSRTGRGSRQAALSPELLDELKDRHARVCPLACPAGQIADGDTCIAAKPSNPAPTVKRHQPRQERENKTAEGHPASVSAEAARRPAAAARVEPARPTASAGGGGGHGGGAGALGVGF
jgi:hypothetical protein